jgi:hypothetical protein
MDTNGSASPVPRYARLDPAPGLAGQLSADVGGLPKVLPGNLYDNNDFIQEEGSSGLPGSPIDLSGEGTCLAESDCLPTYNEACNILSTYTPMDYSPPGSERSVTDDHSGLNAAEASASGKQGSGSSVEHNSNNKSKYIMDYNSVILSVQLCFFHYVHVEKGKLFKMFHSRKKSNGVKSQEKRGDHYQPLIDGMLLFTLRMW